MNFLERRKKAVEKWERKIITESLEKHASIKAVSQDLGITYAICAQMLSRLGLSIYAHKRKVKSEGV